MTTPVKPLPDTALTLTGEPGKAAQITDDSLSTYITTTRLSNSSGQKFNDYFRELSIPNYATPIRAMVSSFNSLATASLNPASMGRLTAQANSVYETKLPSGSFTCDALGQCLKAESNDFSISWKTKSGKDAMASMKYSGQTVRILTSKYTYSTTTYENYAFFPEQIDGSLSVDGKVVASMNYKGSQPASNADGAVLGFKNVTFNAKVLELDGSKTLLDVPGITYTLDANGMQSKGEIMFDNGEKITSKWDVSIGGSVGTDNSSMSFSSGFAPLYTPSNFVPKGAGRVFFATDLDGVQYGVAFKIAAWNTGGNLFPEVTDGKLVVKGKSATFAGSLRPDADGDCVLGENLNVTFSDGVKTLEDVLVDSGQFKRSTCARP